MVIEHLHESRTQRSSLYCSLSSIFDNKFGKYPDYVANRELAKSNASYIGVRTNHRHYCDTSNQEVSIVAVGE